MVVPFRKHLWRNISTHIYLCTRSVLLKRYVFLKFTLFFDLKKTYSDKNDPIFWKYCIQYEDQGNIGQGTFLDFADISS